MADESRWSEDDRYGRDYGEPYRGYGRDYGEPYRGYARDREAYGRRPGPYRGSPAGIFGRERGTGMRGYEYGLAPEYQEFRRDNRFEGTRDQARFGREGNRGWFERAADEVSSWFGDDDAQRRRERDASMGHRGRGPKGYVRSDDRIREDVCDRLSDDSLVDASDIEVSVMGREVTLSGTVQSREERRRAEDCAERVTGVSHVQNNLRLGQAGNTSTMATGRNAGNAIAKGTGQGPGRAAH